MRTTIENYQSCLIDLTLLGVLDWLWQWVGERAYGWNLQVYGGYLDIIRNCISS